MAIRLRSLAAAWLVALPAAAWEWTGEMDGRLEPDNAPAVDWRLATSGDRWRFEASGEGLVARGEAVRGPAGEWREVAVEARIEIGRWLPWARTLFPEETAPLAGWVLSGELVVGGVGSWRPGEWPAGEWTARWTQGEARHDEWGVALSEIEAVVGRGLSGEWRLDGLTASAWGGELSVPPLRLGDGEAGAQGEVSVWGADLAELARLAPQILRAGEGRVSGRLGWLWRAGAGLELREGSLVVEPGDEARVTLAPAPGLLTSQIPERLRALGWISLRNPAHAALGDIEAGRAALGVQALRIEFGAPGTDAEGARVWLDARPPAGQAVERVTFQVNVRGEPAEIWRWLQLSRR